MRDLLALNREMSNLAGRMFGTGDTAAGRSVTWVPPIESFYLDKNLIVRAWVPGIDASKADIRVSGNLLSIKVSGDSSTRCRPSSSCSARFRMGCLSSA